MLCGGVIVADPADPAAAVLAHVRSDRHRAAQGARPTVEQVYHRCHGLYEQVFESCSATCGHLRGSWTSDRSPDVAATARGGTIAA